MSKNTEPTKREKRSWLFRHRHRLSLLGVAAILLVIAFTQWRAAITRNRSVPDEPFQIADNLYYVDSGNNIVRMIDGAGNVTTVAGNGSITYNLYTPHEGVFVINSYGATLGSEQNSGNLGMGMFGALNVQPKG